MQELPAALAPDAARALVPGEADLAAGQRERILAAATEAFARRGHAETTVADIVAAAKVGVGSFYAHFAGKEDCFLAAYRRALARAHEAAAPGPAAALPERVLAVLAALAGLLAAEPSLARLVLIEAPAAGPEARALQGAEAERLAAALRRLRRCGGPHAASLPESSELAALGGAAYYLRRRLLRGEAADPGALLEALAEIVLEPYLGRRRTAALLAG
jgi:AcrR family transcriptional regulator